MPYQLPKSSNTNTNASIVAARSQSREIFANKLNYRQAINNGCVKVSLLNNPVANHDSSIIPDINSGAALTNAVEQAQILENSCKVIVPSQVIPPANFGSLSFPGLLYNQIYIDASETPYLGSGDFTIEWFQYYNDSTTIAYPTVFAYGTYNYDLEAEVYIDNNTNDIWYSEPNSLDGGVVVNIPDPYRNTWAHFAVCRSAGTIYIYQNGYILGSGPSTYNYTNTGVPFSLGNEDSPISSTPFDGKITNFRLTIGNALYPGGIDFTVPSTPLQPVTGTQLLILASTESTFLVDSSPANRTLNNLNDLVTWSSSRPV